MKLKKIYIASMLCVALGLTGCSNAVPREEYEALVAERDNVKKEKSELEETVKLLQTEKTTLESLKQEQEQEYNALDADYKQYKEEMKPFEELSEAEAEARKIEAQQVKEKAEKEEQEKAKAKKEAEKAKKEAAKAKKEAEKAKGYETGITYDQLARTPDDYEGKKVKFKGKVIQSLEGDYDVQIRLAIDDDYDKIILGEYDSSIVSSRILEDDTITIYGVSDGIISYQSTMGGTITIPSIYIDKIDQ